MRIPAIALAILVGCGGGNELRDAGAAMDAGRPRADAGVDAGPIVMTRCQRACDTPSDCARTTADTDADNWDCIGGGCRYIGCSSDAECASGRCTPSELGADVDLCHSACATTADCGDVVGSTGRLECVGGLCQFTGCTDDAFCEQHAWPGSRCIAVPDGVRQCRMPCATSSDCDVLASQLPQACEEGFCLGARCESDAECPMAFGSAYACAPTPP
jgi:hypothetical protein